ncbi:MAG: hypothetical protein ACYCS7_16405 [Acidimicrobiales bacterium]
MLLLTQGQWQQGDSTEDFVSEAIVVALLPEAPLREPDDRLRLTGISSPPTRPSGR